MNDSRPAICYSEAPRYYVIEGGEIRRIYPRYTGPSSDPSLLRVTLEGWPYEYTIHVDGHWPRVLLEELQAKIEQERRDLLGGLPG